MTAVATFLRALVDEGHGPNVVVDQALPVADRVWSWTDLDGMSRGQVATVCAQLQLPAQHEAYDQRAALAEVAARRAVGAEATR